MVPSPYEQGMTANDPLMMQSLSRGGMGYFPDAQMMTPHQYGSFRTLPNGNTQQSQVQRPGLFDSFMYQNQGFGVFNTYNPAVNASRRYMEASRASNDAMLTAGTGVASFSASMFGAKIGSAAGPVGTAVGFGLGAVAGIPLDSIVDRVKSAEELQRATMSKIVTGNTGAFGTGISAGAASLWDQSIRKDSARDTMFNKDDYKYFQSIGTENGMFDFSSGSEGAKKTLTTVVKTFEQLMNVYETLDIPALGRKMQKMQAMGVGINDMSTMGMLEMTAGRAMGMTADQVSNTYGQQGAMIANQLGVAGYHGAKTNMALASQTTLAQRLGLYTPGELSASGGVSGVSQSLTENMMQATYSLEQTILPTLMNADGSYNKERAQKYISGELDFTDVPTQMSLFNGRDAASNYSLLEKNESRLRDSFYQDMTPANQQKFMLNNILAHNKAAGGDLRQLHLSAIAMFGGDNKAATKFMKSIDPAVLDEAVKLHQQTMATRMTSANTKYDSGGFRRLLGRAKGWVQDTDIVEGVADVSEFFGYFTESRDRANIGGGKTSNTAVMMDLNRLSQMDESNSELDYDHFDSFDELKAFRGETTKAKGIKGATNRLNFAIDSTGADPHKVGELIREIGTDGSFKEETLGRIIKRGGAEARAVALYYSEDNKQYIDKVMSAADRDKKGFFASAGDAKTLTGINNTLEDAFGTDLETVGFDGAKFLATTLGNSKVLDTKVGSLDDIKEISGDLYNFIKRTGDESFVQGLFKEGKKISIQDITAQLNNKSLDNPYLGKKGTNDVYGINSSKKDHYYDLNNKLQDLDARNYSDSANLIASYGKDATDVISNYTDYKDMDIAAITKKLKKDGKAFTGTDVSNVASVLYDANINNGKVDMSKLAGARNTGPSMASNELSASINEVAVFQEMSRTLRSIDNSLRQTSAGGD